MEPARELAASLRSAISDERVLAALASVPRERFVADDQRDRAYENAALPIACGQTISQPFVVARMLELLDVGPEERVLDVGTGSGYHAALLARLARHVWTIERHAALSAAACRALAAVGAKNVTPIVGDGSLGLPDQAPFDVINVAAAVGPRVPPALERQLARGGRLIAPVGEEDADQRLVLVRRGLEGGALTRTALDPVRFVPLVEGAP